MQDNHKVLKTTNKIINSMIIIKFQIAITKFHIKISWS